MPGSLIAKWGRIKTNRAKIRRARLGKWGGGGGENGRESPVSPQPSRVSRISFYTFWLTERLFTTILGAWNRLSFVQISSIYWKTTAKAWNCYQRWLCRNGTRISFCNISSGKTGPPFQVFRCSRKFSVGKRTQKVVFHLLSVRISRKVFVNGGCQEPIKIWWAPVVVNHLQKFPSPPISNTPPPVPLSLGRKLFLLSHRSF